MSIFKIALLKFKYVYFYPMMYIVYVNQIALLERNIHEPCAPILISNTIHLLQRYINHVLTDNLYG